MADRRRTALDVNQRRKLKNILKKTNANRRNPKKQGLKEIKRKYDSLMDEYLSKGNPDDQLRRKTRKAKANYERRLKESMEIDNMVKNRMREREDLLSKKFDVLDDEGKVVDNPNAELLKFLLLYHSNVNDSARISLINLFSLEEKDERDHFLSRFVPLSREYALENARTKPSFKNRLDNIFIKMFVYRKTPRTKWKTRDMNVNEVIDLFMSHIYDIKRGNFSEFQKEFDEYKRRNAVVEPVIDEVKPRGVKPKREKMTTKPLALKTLLDPGSDEELEPLIAKPGIKQRFKLLSQDVPSERTWIPNRFVTFVGIIDGEHEDLIVDDYTGLLDQTLRLVNLDRAKWGIPTAEFYKLYNLGSSQDKNVTTITGTGHKVYIVDLLTVPGEIKFKGIKDELNYDEYLIPSNPEDEDQEWRLPTKKFQMLLHYVTEKFISIGEYDFEVNIIYEPRVQNELIHAVSVKYRPARYKSLLDLHDNVRKDILSKITNEIFKYTDDRIYALEITKSFIRYHINENTKVLQIIRNLYSVLIFFDNSNDIGRKATSINAKLKAKYLPPDFINRLSIDILFSELRTSPDARDVLIADMNDERGYFLSYVQSISDHFLSNRDGFFVFQHKGKSLHILTDLDDHCNDDPDCIITGPGETKKLSDILLNEGNDFKDEEYKQQVTSTYGHLIPKFAEMRRKEIDDREKRLTRDRNVDAIYEALGLPKINNPNMYLDDDELANVEELRRIREEKIAKEKAERVRREELLEKQRRAKEVLRMGSKKLRKRVEEGNLELSSDETSGKSIITKLREKMEKRRKWLAKRVEENQEDEKYKEDRNFGKLPEELEMMGEHEEEEYEEKDQEEEEYEEQRSIPDIPESEEDWERRQKKITKELRQASRDVERDLFGDMSTSDDDDDPIEKAEYQAFMNMKR